VTNVISSSKLLERAISLYKEGHFQDALKLLDKITDAEFHIVKHYHRGLVLARMGRLEEALEAFKEIHEIPARIKGFDSGSFLHAYYASLGSLLQQLSKIKNEYRDDAITCYEYALQLKGTDARLWHNLAIAYIDLGMPGEAIDKLKRAIDIEPDFHDARYSLALAYEAIEDIDKAKEQLEKAIETSGTSDIYEKHLATMLVRASRYDEAREHVEHVLLTEPEEPEMLGDMVIILHGAGDFAGAARYYQRLKATGAELGDKWLDKVLIELQDAMVKED